MGGHSRAKQKDGQCLPAPSFSVNRNCRPESISSSAFSFSPPVVVFLAGLPSFALQLGRRRCHRGWAPEIGGAVIGPAIAFSPSSDLAAAFDRRAEPLRFQPWSEPAVTTWSSTFSPTAKRSGALLAGRSRDQVRLADEARHDAVADG